MKLLNLKLDSGTNISYINILLNPTMAIPLALFILIGSMPLVYASNESSYIVGYWAGSNTGPNNGQGNSNSAPYDPSKCKLHPSDTTFWPKNDVEPAVTNQTSCKDGWLDG